jgi:hypothetical protein
MKVAMEDSKKDLESNFKFEVLIQTYMYSCVMSGGFRLRRK